MKVVFAVDNPASGFPTKPLTKQEVYYNLPKLAEVVFVSNFVNADPEDIWNDLHWGLISCVPQYGDKFALVTPYHILYTLRYKEEYLEYLREKFNINPYAKFKYLAVKFLERLIRAASIEVSRLVSEGKFLHIVDLPPNSFFNTCIKNDDVYTFYIYAVDETNQIVYQDKSISLKDIPIVKKLVIKDMEGDHIYSVNIPDYTLIFSKIENKKVSVADFISYFLKMGLSTSYMHNILRMLQEFAR